MLILFAVQSCIIIKDDDVYADFSTEKTIYAVGEIIYFENLSEHADEFHWDFDDGYNSTLRNPKHSFSSPGTYYVELRVYDGAYSDRKKQKIIIE